MTWKTALQSTRVRWAIAFCAITFLMMFLFMPIYYRDVIGPKEGILMNDLFLNFFTPRNWSLPVFVILYVAVIQAFIFYYNDAITVITAVTIYCGVNILRTVTMFALTLEPPTGMILLQDPISSALYPDTGFAKDLFFSGHVSTIMIVVLIEKNRLAKVLKIVGTLIIGVLLAWQHVHYTLDLVVAPLVTYGVFLIIRKYLEIGAENGDLAENTQTN